jgi:GNAT superfamily N-acetyltransferase
MEYRQIRKKELLDYIESPEFRQQSFIPISIARAQSYLHHPLAKEDDVLLHLAEEDGKLLAYLGNFPDEIFVDNTWQRAAWLSCMWVDPACRGKGVAKKFLEMAFEAYDGRILVTEFTPAAESLYKKSDRFFYLPEKEGIRAYYQFNLAEIWSRRQAAFKFLNPLFQFLDLMGNASRKWILNRRNKKTKLLLEEVPFNLDEQDRLQFFLDQHQHQEFGNKDARRIFWMLKHPWIEERKHDELTRKYHFSAVAGQFLFKLYKIKSGPETLLYCCLSLRDGFLKTPYIWWNEDHPYINKGGEIFNKALQHFLYEHGGHTLLTFDDKLILEIRKQPQSWLHIRAAKRFYILGKGDKKAWTQQESRPVFLDAEGDSAFT